MGKEIKIFHKSSKILKSGGFVFSIFPIVSNCALKIFLDDIHVCKSSTIPF